MVSLSSQEAVVVCGSSPTSASSDHCPPSRHRRCMTVPVEKEGMRTSINDYEGQGRALQQLLLILLRSTKENPDPGGNIPKHKRGSVNPKHKPARLVFKP